ncbi:MAG TPA: long-chain fatty acid--CoA ligase, partial [Candidatus Glassbacteria bacterium]|nr:long-chain fatty acid--CoA ligase [Candidatus Glassbacteria bacterium]
GELVIKGPQVMKGYWKRQDETDKVFTEDGWLKTGDVVHMTKDGFFNIVDRLKDCIFTSGFQVWPLDVETVLCNHPDISMAAVIPVKDENVNEVIKAVLVAAQGAKQYTFAELKAYCKENLAPYKVPKYFEYREELPLSPVGKVLRRPLREEAEKVAVKQKK